ncbi:MULTISPECIES: hypothetical protein [unclassified Polynucleobacter]|uniref:hypothetical protein n=1 Tax=unclassified Polynucleobacter TaxID=2640945 RepID=UPI0025E6A10E|nr:MULTISPECIES: hypothetical protein [unclassified Polynucleobacter]
MATIIVVVGFVMLLWGGVVGTQVGIYGNRVANFPTMIIGGVLVLFGMMLFILHKKSHANKELASEEMTFSEEKNIDNDAYKIFLTKKYNINKNLALNKIICKDKLFDTVDDALNYAYKCDTPKIETVTRKAQPEVVDAICPNCDAPINSKDVECWQCSASFSEQSSWKPLPLKG